MDCFDLTIYDCSTLLVKKTSRSSGLSKFSRLVGFHIYEEIRRLKEKISDV
jgi:hypothetical protein